jgi:hypothetical protein
LRLHIEGNKRADHLLNGLLPCCERSGEVHGLNGMRIRQRTKHGIELNRLGRPASLWLTGPSRRAFERAEEDLAQRVRQLAGFPAGAPRTPGPRRKPAGKTHSSPSFSNRPHKPQPGSPAALLRRIGPLHTVAVPQVVTRRHGRLGDLWILELDHLQNTGLRLGESVDALTDTECGLPLQLREHREHKPDVNLGLLLFKDPADTATLELRYDRFDYPTLQKRTYIFTAIAQRISKVTGERKVSAHQRGGGLATAGLSNTTPFSPWQEQRTGRV